MLRSFTVQPLSLVVGVVFSALVLLSMSQAPPLNARNINIQYMPDPRDMVQVHEGAPYTVPSGKLLVITAVGSTDGGGYGPQLRINGQTEVTVTYVFAQNPPSVVPVAPGLTVASGSVVEVFTTPYTNNGRVWGYLAAQ